MSCDKNNQIISRAVSIRSQNQDKMFLITEKWIAIMTVLLLFCYSKWTRIYCYGWCWNFHTKTLNIYRTSWPDTKIWMGIKIDFLNGSCLVRSVSGYLPSVEQFWKRFRIFVVTYVSDTMSTRRLGNEGHFPCNTIDGIINIQDNTSSTYCIENQLKYLYEYAVCMDPGSTHARTLQT